jgi:hypothetical protein
MPARRLTSTCGSGGGSRRVRSGAPHPAGLAAGRTNRCHRIETRQAQASLGNSNPGNPSREPVAAPGRAPRPGRSPGWSAPARSPRPARTTRHSYSRQLPWVQRVAWRLCGARYPTASLRTVLSGLPCTRQPIGHRWGRVWAFISVAVRHETDGMTGSAGLVERWWCAETASFAVCAKTTTKASQKKSS